MFFLHSLISLMLAKLGCVACAIPVNLLGFHKELHLSFSGWFNTIWNVEMKILNGPKWHTPKVGPLSLIVNRENITCSCHYAKAHHWIDRGKFWPIYAQNSLYDNNRNQISLLTNDYIQSPHTPTHTKNKDKSPTQIRTKHAHVELIMFKFKVKQLALNTLICNSDLHYKYHNPQL